MFENAEDNDPHKERLNRTLQNLRVDDDVPSEPDETDYPEDGKGAETDMDSNSMDGDANEDTSESESESEERIVERFVSRRRRRTTLFVSSQFFINSVAVTKGTPHYIPRSNLTNSTNMV